MTTKRLRRACWLVCLLLGPWPAAALADAADEALGADWRQVPEGAAVVILFRDRDRHRGRLRSWNWFLSGKGVAWTGAHLETLLPMNVADAPAPLTAGTATRLTLWPGRYQTTMTRQDQFHDEVLELNAGDLLILQLDADNQAPFARTMSTEAFATHLTRRGGIGWRNVDRRGYQTAHLNEQNLAAVEITPAIDGFCQDGTRKLRWHNAQLEAELVDCSWQHGHLQFDDGTTVALPSLPDLSFRSIIGAFPYPPGSGDVRFYSIAQAGDDRAAAWPGPVPVDWQRWFASGASMLHAIDGEPVTGLEQAQLEALLRGAPGSRLHVTVSSNLPAAGSRRFEFELLRNLNAIEEIGYSPLLPPKVDARLTQADGSGYLGSIHLLAAEDGHLPRPLPEGPGRKVLADGSGYEGHFSAGQADGLMWCFDLDGEGPCEFSGGRRLSETGAIQRSEEEILATQPGFNREMTVDLLRRQHIETLLEERWPAYLQLDSDLKVLGVDTGIEALFYVARALAATGRPDLAEQRAMAYLNLAGADGAAYGDALSLVAELRPWAEHARAMRDAQLTELHALRATLTR